MGELSNLNGIGPKSEQHLNTIGIYTEAQLRDTGAVKTFLRLSQTNQPKPSLNFLYALVGALEDRHWADIAKFEKDRLLIELDGYADLKALGKL